MKTILLGLLIVLPLLVSCSDDDSKNDPVKKEKVAVSFSYDPNAVLFNVTNNNTEPVTVQVMVSYFENNSSEYPTHPNNIPNILNGYGMAQKKILFKKFRLAPKEKKSETIPLKNASYRMIKLDYTVN